ncbi:hypothetical protein Taro_012723 [Colocasia esculenta]|uniref:Uncharacterized protein n=1 Tax=Colocasia esculenta TaxID=4460 RepID=A0A843UEC1_COLES|nr:hypothetical protein [Colocasia esculenta]
MKRGCLPCPQRSSGLPKSPRHLPLVTWFCAWNTWRQIFQGWCRCGQCWLACLSKLLRLQYLLCLFWRL